MPNAQAMRGRNVDTLFGFMDLVDDRGQMLSSITSMEMFILELAFIGTRYVMSVPRGLL